MSGYDPSLTRFLAVDLQAQDEVFRRPFEIIREGMESHSFPAASLAINYAGRLIALKAFGHFSYQESSAFVSTDTVFDLASLTKVLATTPMAMLLYQRGMLDLEAPLVGPLPEFAGNDCRRRQVTFHMLLAHSSGLPAYEKLFLRARDREELVREALRIPLKAEPGSRSEYSDIGFILLGLALEKIAGEPMDQFCRREIFAPLGMAHTAFNPSPSQGRNIPPTAEDPSFRQRTIQGEVQDENASLMGGTAGHAGLFSNASDIGIFAQTMLSAGPIFVPEVIARF
ncbi:MAG: beta-lactamase family protein, partial [Acidobacteria bacterium]|nr:beta-lactamase family protein [Acidobacteriota bacterium]